MIKEWVITNRGGIAVENARPFAVNKAFTLYAHESEVVSFTPASGGGETGYLLIDGYLLPRTAHHSRYARMEPAQLAVQLYNEYGDGFIEYIKGSFIIVLVIPGRGFSIFTDRLGLRKVFYFYREDGGDFILSNRFHSIAGNVETKPDVTAVALEALMHHYIDGTTFLEGIRYSSPASRIVGDESGRTLSFHTYWDCTRLLDLETADISPGEMAGEFKTITRNYIDYLKPGKVSVTLTGGLDSRTILAALLNIGIRPHAFTYGHPESLDVATALEIAGKCDLKYHNHYVQPTAGWFSQQSEEIVDKGDSITQLHRAHRLAAIRMETEAHPDTDMVMGGYMGGEYIRNFYYDGVTVPGFVKSWLHGQGDKRELIRDTLEERFLGPPTVDTDRIYDVLAAQPYFNDSTESLKVREFFLTFLLLAGTHHSQDLHLFGHFIKYPVPVYLDIDFLHLIFRSRFNFLNGADNPGSRYKKYMKRIKGAELYCEFIENFSPVLAGIPFAKKGYYSAHEYVTNSTPLLTAKRVKRYALNRRETPANFALGAWMADFTKWQLNRVGKDSPAAGVFDMEKAKHRLNAVPPPPYEKDWRRYTDIIWLHLATKHYLEKK